MKKICLVMMVLCLSVGVTACTAEAQGYTKAAVGTETGQSADTELKGTTETESTAPTGEKETLETESVTGIVEEAAVNTLVIKTEDQIQYRFSTDQAVMSVSEEGLLAGDKVTVTYINDGGEWMPAQSIEVSVQQ